jgi:hypothetical protein
MRVSDYLKGWIACRTMQFVQAEDICLKSVYEGSREVLLVSENTHPI